MKLTKKVAQKGFTLIEMLVALAILSLIVAIGMSAFDGSKSKAQALLGLTKQISDANIMAKEDIGCFSTSPVGLFDQTVANSSYPCRANPTLTRLYTPRQSVSAATPTEIRFAKIAEDVSIAFGRVTGTGLGNRYYVQAKNVPMDVLRHALSECNGDANVEDMTSVAKLSAYRCVASTLTGEKGDFYLQYAETR